MEVELRDRSADFDSDGSLERDILDDDEAVDAVVLLDKADGAAISRERSLSRSSKAAAPEPEPKKAKPEQHINLINGYQNSRMSTWLCPEGSCSVTRAIMLST